MTDLKSIVKRKIIDDVIKFVKPESRVKIVVLDSGSLPIINSVCTMDELRAEDVSDIGFLERRRSPYPNFDAIYIISPTDESVKHLLDDFKKGKPPYAYVHLFFTSELNDRLLAKIKGSILHKYVRNLREIDIDFIAFESQVFTFDNPQSFFKMYNAPDHLQYELECIAKRLVSVMATLGEYPFIRFHDSTSQRSSLSSRLASILQRELDELCIKDDNFPPKSPYPPGTLIILDRGYDPMAPLLHEFTYQAMANDLVFIEDGSKYVYEYTGEDGSPVNKTVILDDNDALWVQYRHTFIAEVTSGLGDQFKRFMSENRAATASTSTSNNNTMRNGSPNDIRQLKETLQDLPEFQRMKEKFGVHTNLAQECMNIFNKKRLNDIGNVEQCLATGENPDGTEPKQIVMDMVPLLIDRSISSLDKVRLLMLYIIIKHGLQDEDRRKLLDRAGLSLNEIQAITNLSMLGVRLSKEEGVDRNRKSMKPKKKNKDGDVPYDLSRYIPKIKSVMEDQVYGRLSTSIFPYNKDHPEASESLMSGISPYGVKGFGDGSSSKLTRPSWAKKASDRSSGAVSENNVEDLRKNGGRIILFVLGGATYSETRSAYEIMKELRREVIIGSTHILDPLTFINSLKVLHRGANAKLPDPNESRLKEASLPSSSPKSPRSNSNNGTAPMRSSSSSTSHSSSSRHIPSSTSFSSSHSSHHRHETFPRHHSHGSPPRKSSFGGSTHSKSSRDRSGRGISPTRSSSASAFGPTSSHSISNSGRHLSPPPGNSSGVMSTKMDRRMMNESVEMERSGSAPEGIKKKFSFFKIG